MTEPLYRYDLLIKNARVVRPRQTSVEHADIGIKNGIIHTIAPQITPTEARNVHDAKGWLAFPGLVDAHMHVGIYTLLEKDATTESKAAAMGGVTSAITYFRTGQYYLNKAGLYANFYPEVLGMSEGRYYVDYAYHLAPISRDHIGEMEYLAVHLGVPSFKIFMFYGGYGLHGRSDAQQSFLMIGEDERYNFAHFEFILREAGRLIQAYPAIAPYISVSLHCEVADILNAYTQIVQKEGKLSGLPAYSAARPPHSEALAIWIAAYLAYETNCLNINLLHLSSRKAVEAARMMAALFPHIQFRRETTIGHLLLDIDNADIKAKVNPPIRPRDDVEFLWRALLDGGIDWVVSDHACCSAELKTNPDAPADIWLAKSGFGGTEYLLSGLHSEGIKRGLSLNRMAELVSWTPAQRFGLLNKGDLAPGYDADIVLFDPAETFTVRAADSPSGQGYTPFEGQTLTGRVKYTYLRGIPVYSEGKISGSPRGQYMHRPTRMPITVEGT
ncbi:MAG TPA: dihydroorotase family protein [Aggregatilineales bacterium]|nr:dihydroorotase family protein [Anaerolineales bacterium]HRE47765.1 dihydroorotase family protein [Aggregatilineales bacterium]